MVKLSAVCSGAVLGQRPPPPRLLDRLLFFMDEPHMQQQAISREGILKSPHFKSMYAIHRICCKSIKVNWFHKHMGVSSSRSRVQTLPLTRCSIGGAWSVVPLPPPQRSVRWPAPLSTRVLIAQYRVTI
ncbi:hypothetical protein VPH35_033442 [Triticum aestivum]